MADLDEKKLEDLLKQAIKPVKELVEVLKSKVDRQEFYLEGTSSDVKSLKEQQSVINEKLDAHGRQLDAHGRQLDAQGKKLDVQGKKLDVQGKQLDAQGKRLSSLDSKVDKQGEKLKTLWHQMEKVTIGLDDVKETQGLHTAVLKRIESKVENNSEDIKKLDKRLTGVENNAGIVPPPELTVN